MIVKQKKGAEMIMKTHKLLHNILFPNQKSGVSDEFYNLGILVFLEKLLGNFRRKVMATLEVS